MIRIAVLVVAAWPAVAAADAPATPPPDPAVATAGDANLESTDRRQGRNVALALGGGLTVGFGLEDTVGNGGALSLRLGQAATPHTVLTAELAVVVLLHKVSETQLERNEDTNLLVGAQHYVNGTLWVRGALGLGVFRGRSIGDGMGGLRDVTLPGPAWLIGAGLDMVRTRRLSFGVELMTIAQLNREGLLSSSGLLLDLVVE